MHFGCDTLEGAEIENQGGDATARSHWEKRLFEVQIIFCINIKTVCPLVCIYFNFKSNFSPDDVYKICMLNMHT